MRIWRRSFIDNHDTKAVSDLFNKDEVLILSLTILYLHGVGAIVRCKSASKHADNFAIKLLSFSDRLGEAIPCSGNTFDQSAGHGIANAKGEDAKCFLACGDRLIKVFEKISLLPKIAIGRKNDR